MEIRKQLAWILVCPKNLAALTIQAPDGFDAIVLTHGHRDHTGGAAAAAAKLAVARWYCGGKAAAVLAGVVLGWIGYGGLALLALIVVAVVVGLSPMSRAPRATDQIGVDA